MPENNYFGNYPSWGGGSTQRLKLAAAEKNINVFGNVGAQSNVTRKKLDNTALH